MVSRNEVETARQHLRSLLREHRSPRSFLLARQVNSDSLAEKAMTSLLLLQGHMERSYEEGLDWLDQGERFFAKLVLANRLNRGHQRDFVLTKGNFFARWGYRQKANECYVEAIRGDSNHERRALSLLNQARLALIAHDFYHALYHCQTAHGLKPERRQTRIAIELLRARVFLILGCDHEAVGIIRREKDLPEDKRLKREHRYLGLMARFGYGSSKVFLRRWQEYLNTVKELESEEVHAYYVAEYLLINALLAPESIHNRQNYLERSLAMARAGRAMDFHTLCQELIHLKKATTENHRLQDITSHLIRFGALPYHPTFQIVAITFAQKMIERKAYEFAVRVLDAVDHQWEQAFVSFPEEESTQYSQSKGPLRTLVDGLWQQIPSHLRGHRTRADQWFLDA